ncbi:MAG: tetratricopeptide repeat protein [Bacteroidales bacterium]|jgi:tetratricopeptide (TPR) repeat protein|nr:tetratricopeptide repeat protein [Bacteroidales bacterium]
MRKLFVTFFLSVAGVAVYAQDAATLISEANAALTAKKYADAYAKYQKAMANPGDAEIPASINYNIGLAAYKAKKYADCIPYFTKAIAAKANVKDSYENIGFSNLLLGKTDAAEAAFTEAAKVGSKKGTLYQNCGVMLYNDKKYDLSLQYFDKAVAAGYDKPGDIVIQKKVVLEKGLNKPVDEIKQLLIDGNKKYPADKKIATNLAKIYFTEGNDLYVKGAKIFNDAADKTKSGALKITDDAYKSEVAKAKTELTKGQSILAEALKVDPSNANAKSVSDAIKDLLATINK